MIEHFLYSFVFLLFVASFGLMLFVSTQQDHWLGAWQNVLQKRAEKGTAWSTMLSKWGGHCQICFSWALTMLFLPLYFIWMYLLREWSIEGYFLNGIWISAYICIGTNFNLFFITKLYK